MAFTYELKADEMTLKWEEPKNNGAEIAMYTVYCGTQSDEQWKETKEITDVSIRKYVLKVEMGQKYKVLVTASNKYGESSKEDKMQRVDVPQGGLSSSLTERVYLREIHSRAFSDVHYTPTGGHFACAFVHPLNDNSVGASYPMAGNRKLA